MIVVSPDKVAIQFYRAINRITLAGAASVPSAG